MRPDGHQRPQVDLKFYKDICPDRNGTPLRTFVTVPTERCGVDGYELLFKEIKDRTGRNVAREGDGGRAGEPVGE